MAKTINLTVRVDDNDFKQFVNKFNAFTAQIGVLNRQFQNINTTIQKAQVNAQGFMSFINSMISGSQNLYGWVEKLGKGIIRWGSAIGSIVTMLSTGAGLFGIDRLAESIMQKRRQALGLGTTRGGLIGFEAGARTLVSDPAAMLAGVRTAMGGGPGMGALGTLGVPFGSFGGDPVKAMPTILENLWKRLQGVPQNVAVRVGQQITEGQGLTGFPPELFTRLARANRQQLDEILREILPAKDMTPEAQKGWAELTRIFKLAKANIESAFGERFAELTKPLGELSTAFQELVRALLKSRTVTDLIHWLTTQLNKLTKTLTEDPDAISKKIKEFDDYIEKEWMPLLRKLKDAIGGFAEGIENTKASLKRLTDFWYLIWWRLNHPIRSMLGEDPREKVPGAGTPPQGQAGGVQGEPGTPSGPAARPGGQVDPLRPPFGPNVPLNRILPPLMRGQQPTVPSPISPTTRPSTTTTPTPPAGTTPPSPPPLAPSGPTPPVPGTTTSPETNVPPWQKEREQRSQLFMPGNFINQQFASVQTPGPIAAGVTSAAPAVLTAGVTSAAPAAAPTAGVTSAAQAAPATQSGRFLAGSSIAMGGVTNNLINLGRGSQAIRIARNQFGGPSRRQMANLSFTGIRGNITGGDRIGGDVSYKGGDRIAGDVSLRGGDRIGGDLSIRRGGQTGMFASIRGGNRIAVFGGAAQERVPGKEMSQFRGTTPVSTATDADTRRGLAMLKGPLDMDNWQMNRTTNLTIRNVPGSNIFAQSVGMG